MANMKKTLLKISALVALLPSLNACNNNSRVILMNSLDVMSGQVEKMRSVSGDFITSLINTKQNFVLYFKVPGCSTCQKVEPYFTKLINENKYHIYSFSAADPSFSEMYQNYPDYFNEAPKTLFFKDGELKLTLSNNKYENERLFLKAMNEFCIKSEMYTATTSNGLNYFLESFTDFLVYIMDFENQNTYRTFSEIVYPIISTSDSPSLIIDMRDLGESVYQNFLSAYDLDDSITSWAFKVENGEKQNAVNYLDNSESLKLLLQGI